MDARNPPTFAEDVETIRKEADVLIPRSPAVLQLANGMAKRVILPIIFELIQIRASAKTQRAIARIREVWRQEDLIADAVAAEKKRKRKPDGKRLTQSAKDDKDEARKIIEAADGGVWNQQHMQVVARHMLAYKQRQLAAAEGNEGDVLANGLTFRQMQAQATFAGVAYNGQIIRQEGIPLPMYVDLATIKAIVSKDGTQPALMNHDSQKAVGHHLPVVATDKLTVSNGRFSVDNMHSREIVAAAADGYTWHASIRGRFDRVTMIKKDQTARVNGRTIDGPAIIAHAMRWRETSFTALGANAPSEAGVNAEFEITINDRGGNDV